eukprot:scaffold1516_cov230-Pinguiococcus_pyrenoidosus.AAC.14
MCPRRTDLSHVPGKEERWHRSSAACRGLHVANNRVANCKLRISGCRLQVANCELQKDELRVANTDLRIAHDEMCIVHCELRWNS